MRCGLVRGLTRQHRAPHRQVTPLTANNLAAILATAYWPRQTDRDAESPAVVEQGAVADHAAPGWAALRDEPFPLPLRPGSLSAWTPERTLGADVGIMPTMKCLALVFTLTAASVAFTAPDAGAQGPPASLVRDAERGRVESQAAIGAMYYFGHEGVPRDFAKAAKWSRLAAEQGHAASQSILGRMYYDGDGLPLDYAEAAKWFRLAAEQGSAYGQYRLGMMYYHGAGVPQDYAEAERRLRLAAKQGNTAAQHWLALSYHHGEGFPQDSAEAAWWYRHLAEQGTPYFQYILGMMYYHGDGVPQDFAKAEKWCLKAAAQGYKFARECVQQAMARQ